MLVAEKNVMRVGKGGRADPFMYQVMHSVHKLTAMQHLEPVNNACLVSMLLWSGL